MFLSQFSLWSCRFFSLSPFLWSRLPSHFLIFFPSSIHLGVEREILKTLKIEIKQKKYEPKQFIRQTLRIKTKNFLPLIFLRENSKVLTRQTISPILKIFKSHSTIVQIKQITGTIFVIYLILKFYIFCSGGTISRF